MQSFTFKVKYSKITKGKIFFKPCIKKVSPLICKIGVLILINVHFKLVKLKI